MPCALICGSLEYGASYPIDSEYFPYKSELMEQIKYFRDNYIYVGAHFYTTAYSSAEREAYELQRHLESLKLYGVVSDKLGGIGAATPTGLFWGTRTLLQMLRQTPGSVPCGTAVDFPRYELRGFMLDIARCKISENASETADWHSVGK